VVRQSSALVIVACVLIAVCTGRRAAEQPLQRSAYVWQRQWTSTVCEAIAASSTELDGIVALGAEIEWNGWSTRVIESSINWAALHHFRKCGIALRVTPVTNPQQMQQFPLAVVAAEARKLLSKADEHGVSAELQLDFDSTVQNLGSYAQAVAALRGKLQPTRLVVTTLPAWLDSEGFTRLLNNCDSYVLQVHSVPLRTAPTAWKICDPALARQWVDRAAAYKKPFSVALPTYRCIAGYTPSGQLLGVTMDAVQGRWPPGTKLHEVATDPDEMADLVRDWRKHHPPELREIAWYRLPVATDARNWRFTTFLAVANGRRPHRQVDVISHGENLIDVAICNNGEADERLDVHVLVDSDQSAIAADALNGWWVEQHEKQAVFTTNPGETSQLRPGETRNIGWLRFGAPAKLQLHLLRQ